MFDYDKAFLNPQSPLVIICGPCVIEGEKAALYAAESLKKIFSKFPCLWVYKSSYDKANRSAIESYRGPGLDKGLKILQKVKEEFQVPILSDVHQPEEVTKAKEVCDILQVPAFLARQTDLITACGNSGQVVNIKKGQFMAPWDMKHTVKKIEASGNRQLILTDRGSCFGITT